MKQLSAHLQSDVSNNEYAVNIGDLQTDISRQSPHFVGEQSARASKHEG